MKKLNNILAVSLVVLLIALSTTVNANGQISFMESYNFLPGIETFDVEDQIALEDWMIEVDLIKSTDASQLEDWMLSENLMEESFETTVENWMINSDLIDEKNIPLDEWMFNFDL